MALSRWHVLSLVDGGFLQGVERVVVFGTSGNEALLLTHGREVYAVGANGNCCLGLGTTNPAGFNPKKIESLTGLYIKDIRYGSGPHVLALTVDGQIYSWGGNGYGQLGHGSTSVYENTPRLVNNSLCGIGVTLVACGGFHSLALSNNGEVYSWGFNNCGQLGTSDMTSHYHPIKITGPLEGKVCTFVVCSHASSFSLTNLGEVFSWGQNGSGQLGIGSTLQQNLPCIVPFFDAIVVQLVAGYSHVLALTDTGEIYSWGANTHGQLGNGSKQCLTSPFHICKDMGKASEVAAVHLSHVSTAVIDDNVLAWGECYHQNILNPLKTPFANTDEVFSCLSSPACSWRMFKNLVIEKKTDLSHCIEKRYNDPTTSDLTFIVEGRYIKVHKAILRIRSNYFYSMLQNGKWKESEMDTFEISDHSFTVFNAFLSYFYTDKVDIPTEDVPGLLEVADCYCENELKKLCEQILIRKIDTENVATLYSVAQRYQGKRLEEASFNYISRHCSAVICSKDFNDMDGVTVKKLLIRLASVGVFKS